MKTEIIAEIGINHNGDLGNAQRLIDVALFAGCDSVKFQKRNPDVCVPDHQKNLPKSTPWGDMTYLDYKHRMEFGREEYDFIDDYCKNRNIEWSVSVWDLDSLEFINRYDLSFLKIPSAMLTNKQLIAAACETGKRIIVSTGMSTVEEVDEAVELLHRSRGGFALMHCNSSYPAPLGELNLSCIKTLIKRYRVPVGYSGHEFRLGTSVAAIYLGASIIERHITLDRSSWGTDQLSSVEPQGLIKLVSGIRELEESYGDGVIGVTESEISVRRKLRGD